jgi:mRNA interferase MazF
MKQGEIYLVQYDPSTGHEFQKARPAIVLSSPYSLQTSNLVTFVAMTTKTKSPIADDIVIIKNNTNRLAADSLIKVQHISSFDKQRIMGYIGEISKIELQKIKSYFIKHFDL